MQNAHDDGLLAFHYADTSDVLSHHHVDETQIAHAPGVLYGRRRRLADVEPSNAARRELVYSGAGERLRNQLFGTRNFAYGPRVLALRF